MNYREIKLKPGKEKSLANFHPWVFSGAVGSFVKDIEEGAIVEVFSHEGAYLATGHFHLGTIMVRVLSFQQVTIDQNFWTNRIHGALQVRMISGVIRENTTTTYRLIHGEGDQLPGLIIDVYGSTSVIQSHTIGMDQHATEICEALKQVFGSKLDTVYFKTSENNNNRHLLGSLQESLVSENDVKFLVNWVEGQKTGFFLDQRDNRQLLASYSKGKVVLNTFCYSGGFSLYALKAGAVHVDSVDSSKKAIEWTDKNVQLNFPEGVGHQSYAMDVFDFFRQSDKKYDVIILDPPAFAKHLNAVNQAVNGYKNLNYEAISRIKPGGIIFTFSCSQAVDKLLFRKAVFAAARKAGRQVRILHQLTQGADHPVSIFHPEGEYLKGLVLHVE